jgi:Domain of unknown function (DUF5134)
VIWTSALLAVACLAVAALHVLRLGVLRSDLPGEAAHAAMGLGMAAMFSPIGAPLPNTVWVVAFVVSGTWFGARALREGRLAGNAGHHVIGSVAMLVMLSAEHSHTPAGGGAEHTGHAAHGGAVSGFGLTTVVSVLLAGYFVWHVLRCTDRWRLVRSDMTRPVPADARVVAAEASTASPTAGAVAPRRSPRTVLLGPAAEVAAHLSMSVAMTVMLLGVV